MAILEFRKNGKAIDCLYKLIDFYIDEVKNCADEKDLKDCINNFYRESTELIASFKLDANMIQVLSHRISEEIVVLVQLYNINKQA